MWCVPEIDDEYRTRLFNLCDLYERPHDPRVPVVCLDEKCIELRADSRPIQRTRKGLLRDSDYIRHGTANIFVMTEPKGGRHFARITKRRTALDFAACLKWLAARYRDAVVIDLVMDNLNTHTEKSVIRKYGEREGRRLWARFRVHYTPKHGSWLNQAEIAIGVMSRACLKNQRISSIAALKERVLPFWQKRRDQRWKIDWRFTSKKAKSWLNQFETEH